MFDRVIQSEPPENICDNFPEITKTGTVDICLKFAKGVLRLFSKDDDKLCLSALYEVTNLWILLSFLVYFYCMGTIMCHRKMIIGVRQKVHLCL